MTSGSLGSAAAAIDCGVAAGDLVFSGAASRTGLAGARVAGARLLGAPVRAVARMVGLPDLTIAELRR